ncbi:hypothetical protein Tcan_00530, partial [Toxocara canis]
KTKPFTSHEQLWKCEFRHQKCCPSAVVPYRPIREKQLPTVWPSAKWCLAMRCFAFCLVYMVITAVGRRCGERARHDLCFCFPLPSSRRLSTLLELPTRSWLQLQHQWFLKKR